MYCSQSEILVVKIWFVWKCFHCCHLTWRIRSWTTINSVIFLIRVVNVFAWSRIFILKRSEPDLQIGKDWSKNTSKNPMQPLCRFAVRQHRHSVAGGNIPTVMVTGPHLLIERNSVATMGCSNNDVVDEWTPLSTKYRSTGNMDRRS